MSRSGAFRHQIIIEHHTEVTDEFGQAIKTWATFVTPFAAVKPLRGQELFASQQYNAKITTRIRTRYMANITADMRVSFGGRLFNIESVIDPDERKKEIHLMCSEGMNDG